MRTHRVADYFVQRRIHGQVLLTGYFVRMLGCSIDNCCECFIAPAARPPDRSVRRLLSIRKVSL